MVSFLEGQLRSRIDREERKKVLLEAKLSDDASETEDVDLSSFQAAEKDSAEKDPPPQHINCHVLQPAQEDDDGVTPELGVLQWHEEDGPEAVTAPAHAYQQLLQLGLVLEHQGARAEVLQLLFLTVWRGQGSAPALAAAQLMTYYEQLPETGEAPWVPSLAVMLDALVALGYRDPSLTTCTSPGQAAPATHTWAPCTRAPCTRHHQAAGSLLNALLLLLSSPAGGGPLLLELSQALSGLVAAWGAEGRSAAGRDPEGVAWRAAAAAAADTVSRAGPSYQAGLRIIQALPPTSPQLVQLKQECALSLLQQLCRQAPPTNAPDPSGSTRLGGRPKEASINLTMARHVLDLLEGVAKNPLKLVYHVDDLECKGHPRSLDDGKARAVAGASYYRAMAMLECALAVIWPLLTASLNQDGITVCSQFLQYLQGVNNTPPQMKDPASMSFLAKVSKMVNRVQHMLGEANYLNKPIES